MARQFGKPSASCSSFWKSRRSFFANRPTAWLALAAAGVVATAGQLLLTQAYTLAPAAHIGALIYTTVLFAALIGWLVWHETPDALSLAGGAAVILAAVIVVFARRASPGRAT